MGAAETWQAGWYSTNEQWFDITNKEDWDALFKGQRKLTHVVAEHVFEHLTPQGAQQAVENILRHLVDGGRLRIAVPDGSNPNADYIEHVKIGGIGDDAADHKQLYTSDSLIDLLEKAGLKAVLVEGYDDAGRLVQNTWDEQDGFIRRSRQNAGQDKPWTFPDADTSLIVDGVLTGSGEH